MRILVDPVELALGTVVREVGARSDGRRIHTFGESVWWAVTTTTAVNYGDAYPSTTVGKVLALMVMLVGATVFTMITAELAAMFVAADAAKHQGDSPEDLHRKLDEILERLRARPTPSPAGRSEPM